MQEDIKVTLENTNNTPQQHKLIMAYVTAHIIFKNAQKVWSGVTQKNTGM